MTALDGCAVVRQVHHGRHAVTGPFNAVCVQAASLTSAQLSQLQVPFLYLWWAHMLLCLCLGFVYK